MSESYKTHQDGLYFVTFSVIGWVDIFIRRPYQEVLIDSIQFCQKNKALRIYSYCIMPSHVHLIAYSENGHLSGILRDLKAFTARKLLYMLEENYEESRKEWIMKLFRFYGKQSPQKQHYQFWKHNNHPFYLYTRKMIQQKIDYIHDNPVDAGFVNRAIDWRLSSASSESPILLNDIDGICYYNSSR